MISHKRKSAGINIYINCLMMASLFVGLGPGGLTNIPEKGRDSFCLLGSSHGGSVSKSTGRNEVSFQVGAPYDKENLKTFQGGSGGDVRFSLAVCSLQNCIIENLVGPSKFHNNNTQGSDKHCETSHFK